MSDKITTSLTTLLTGFLVVFAVLLLLILVIKIYGTIVYNIQNKSKERKKQSNNTDNTQTQASVVPSAPMNVNGISGEVVAAIAAAVDYVYGSKKAVIKSIKKSENKRSAWHNAGVMRNTRPF